VAASCLRLHVCALGVLWRRRAAVLLLGLLSILLLLLILRGVGVLVVDGWLGLASDVGRLGVLLHGYCEGVSDRSLKLFSTR
jgi:hypothetical protein